MTANFNLTDTPQLSFRPAAIAGTYNVAFYRDDDLLASYLIQVAFIKNISRSSVIRLDRIEYNFSDSEEVQNHAFDLAAACGKILYPMDIILDEHANITGISNHKEIINRWLKQAPALGAYYIGDAAASYLAQTEQILMNADALTASMRRDFFISAFFMPLNMNIRDGNAAEMHRKFYLPEQATATIEQYASILKEDNDRFQVHLSGASMPGEPVSFDAEAQYVLQRPSCKIESVDFLWKIKEIDDPHEINIKIELKK